MSMEDNLTDRAAALVEFLDDGTEIEDVTWEDHGDIILLTIGKREYLVLTDEEADKVAEERIKDSLWAFRSDFICTFCGLNDTATILAIEKMQEKLCESANPIIERLIGEEMSDFIKEAISADGRGHFMSSYDGYEIEQGAFFIYRQN